MYVEGLLFQNLPKPKNHPCQPRSPIFSHSTKLGYATFCWFCDAGSQFFLHIAFNIDMVFLCNRTCERLTESARSITIHRKFPVIVLVHCTHL